MAERRGPQIFRKKSLERLSSPERLDHLLEVVDRKSWIPLAAIGVLVLGVLTWAVFARIPVNVEGKGILVRPRKIVEFQSPGPGRVVRLEVDVGSSVRRGQLLARIQRPDLEEQLRLQKTKVAELTAQNLPAAEASEVVAPDPGVGPQGRSLRDHIELSRDLAEKLRRERREFLEEEERRIDEQEKVARQLSESLRDRVEKQKGLLAQQLVSDAEYDRTEEEYMDSLERFYDIQAQRSALQTARLEADEQYYDRVQRIAEWNFGLTQQIADVHREIATLEQRLKEESRVASEYDGRILELSVASGRYVGAGERLGAMEVSDPSSSLKAVTYFQVRDGKRLQRGSPIFITPDTAERERFGSIRGEVRTVSGFPVSVEEATSVVGNRVVAETLIAGGYLIEVTAELGRSPGQPDRYDWTSSSGAERIDVSAGITTTARVAVERERPIAFVLPLLKSTAGLD
jgi:HlyD family secretion protein